MSLMFNGLNYNEKGILKDSISGMWFFLKKICLGNVLKVYIIITCGELKFQ